MLSICKEMAKMVKKVVRLLVLGAVLGGMVLQAVPAQALDSSPPIRIPRPKAVKLVH
jgi:hypothetical protein